MPMAPKVPALILAKPTETPQLKATLEVLVLKGFLNFGVFHRAPKYRPHVYNYTESEPAEINEPL